MAHLVQLVCEGEGDIPPCGVLLSGSLVAQAMCQCSATYLLFVLEITTHILMAGN